MYTIAEYLVYVALVLVLGASLFVTSVMLVLTQEGARLLAESSRHVAQRVVKLGITVPRSRLLANLTTHLQGN